MSEFILNIDKSYREYTDCDEWSAAELILGDYGVDYNYCMDCGESECAMYWQEYDGEYWHDDTSTYEHYDIEWDKLDWRERLENAMCKFYERCEKEVKGYAWKE